MILANFPFYSGLFLFVKRILIARNRGMSDLFSVAQIHDMIYIQFRFVLTFPMLGYSQVPPVFF